MQLPMRVPHHTHRCAILFGVDLQGIMQVNKYCIVRPS